ncbi:MAG: ribonuclease P protein component [Schleiferiaceae bacterium]|jgi:ribonuclease P protein component|nr:ribonuclease P protein component [Schleiferiaceae bacterium]
MANTFTKSERLNSKFIIDKLFDEGKSFIAYPLRFSFLPYSFDENIQGQVLIIVSKRRLKKAVDRNRTKRIIREAYRMQKQQIYNLTDVKLAMAVSFIGKEPLTLEAAEKSLTKIIARLKEQLA